MHFSKRFTLDASIGNQLSSLQDEGHSTSDIDVHLPPANGHAALTQRLKLAEIKAAKHKVDTETLKIELDKAMTLAERAVQESERLRGEHKQEKLWWVSQAERMRKQMEELVSLHQSEKQQHDLSSVNIGTKELSSTDAATAGSTGHTTAADDWVNSCAHTISRAAGACSAVRAIQEELMSGIRCAENGGRDRSTVSSKLFTTEAAVCTRLGATMVVFDATVAAMASYVLHVKKVAIDATQTHSRLTNELNRVRKSVEDLKRQASLTIHPNGITSSLRDAKTMIEAHVSSETPPLSPEPEANVPVPSPVTSVRQQQQQQQQHEQEVYHHHHHHHHHHHLATNSAGFAATPFKDYLIPPTPTNTPAQLPQNQTREGAYALADLAPLTPARTQEKNNKKEKKQMKNNKEQEPEEQKKQKKDMHQVRSSLSSLSSSLLRAQEINDVANQVIEAHTSKVAMDLNRRFERAFGGTVASGLILGSEPTPIFTKVPNANPVATAAGIYQAPTPWTAPRMTLGKFGEVEESHGLLDMLEKDWAGKVDACEMVDDDDDNDDDDMGVEGEKESFWVVPTVQPSSRESESVMVDVAAVVDDRNTRMEELRSLNVDPSSLTSPVVSPENRANYDRMRKRMVSELAQESPKSRRGPRVRGFEGKAMSSRAERFSSYGTEEVRQSTRKGRKTSLEFNMSSVQLG